MKLFYKPGACSLASHITLRESGKDFTLVSVDLMKKRLENGDNYCKRKLTAVCSHQTRIGNLDAHLI